jgi:hypothetical protein
MTGGEKINPANTIVTVPNNQGYKAGNNPSYMTKRRMIAPKQEAILEARWPVVPNARFKNSHNASKEADPRRRENSQGGEYRIAT